MYLVKILVESEHEAEAIVDLLKDGEEDGALDFVFSTRITERMSPAKGRYNLFHEGELL